VKIVLRVLAAIVALAVALVVALYWVIKPPAPLDLPPRGATLSDVTVIEPGRARSEHRRVVVAGDAIEFVGEAAPGANDPYAGMFVLPGLADLHVHFPPSSLPGQTELFALLHLAHGVTTVRDAGDVDGTASDPARRGVGEGRFPGPRIFACGPFVDGEPKLWKNTLLARNPDEGRAAVKSIGDRGYDCVKAYNNLDAATLAAIRDAAHARNLRVIGHVPVRVGFEDAQLDDAQHLIGIAPPPEDRTKRFPFIMAEWERLDDARLETMIAAAKRAGTTLTPTLVTIDRLIATQDYAHIREESDAELLPRFYRDLIWNPTGGTSVAGAMKPDDFAMLGRAFAAQKRTVKRLYDAGVPLHTGTDSLIAFVVPGASLHRELRILVDAGLTPEQALALSRDSAAYLGGPKLGTLAAGAPADLVVFREDPTQSLDALATLAAVVRDGRLYSREMLDAQLERYRAHFDGKLYDAIVTPMVRRALAGTRGGHAD
jgi:imidazolonepropionase-like amidohydrolase